MKILLVLPASGSWRGIAKKKSFNGKAFRFSMLSLLSVAALTPKEHEVTIIDEQVENTPFDKGFDLVGVSCMTATSRRAYEICKRFREKGIPTVLGGYHPTLNQEEATANADAVVVGCAYRAWQRLLKDLENGVLKSVYRGDPKGQIPVTLPRDLISHDDYVTVNATFATMGCTRGCRFCSVNCFHKGEFYTRPVRDLYMEVSRFEDEFFILVDDNLTLDREHAFKICRALMPLNKKWVSQVSIELAEDKKLLDVMKRAGCIGVFTGLETFSEEALKEQEKGFNLPEKYRQAVDEFHHRGMFVEAGIVFGFDVHDVYVFRETLRMLDESGVDAIQVSIYTPLPGTPLYEEMKHRIFDFNPDHYSFRKVVFYPEKMTPEELQQGTDWVIRKFYSPWRIIKRLSRWITMPGGIKNLIYPFGLNIAYYGRIKRFGIKGRNPQPAMRVRLPPEHSLRIYPGSDALNN